MDLILQLLRKIHKQPLIYLGKKSIERLDVFLTGYIYRQCEIDEGFDANCMRGFQEYVEALYNTNLCIKWSEIIKLNCPDDEKAFEIFFTLFEKYLESESGFDSI